MHSIMPTTLTCLLTSSALMLSCKIRNFHTQVSEVASEAGQIETDAEFAAADDKFFIVGVSKEVVQQTCSAVRIYSSFVAARNSLPIPAECIIDKVPENLKSNLQYPAYSYSREKFWAAHLERFDWHADISTILPRQLWSRFREHKAYNSVCYNSAIVGSGIFPIDGLSMFEPPVDILLGFLRPRVAKAPDGKHQLSMIRESETNALVAKRRSWEVGKNEIEKNFSLISNAIADGFSPANVMCVSIGKLENSKSILLKMNERIPNSSILDAPDEAFETAGGHCLNFLTPSLIMEANRELPYNFTNWRRAFDLYANMGGNEPTVFHYIQFKDKELLNWSRRENITTNQQFAKLLKITSDFREFHEGLTLSPDTKEMPQIRISDFLRQGDSRPEVLEFRKYAFERLLPSLDGHEFAGFKKMLDDDRKAASPSTAAAFSYWETIYKQVSGWRRLE